MTHLNLLLCSHWNTWARLSSTWAMDDCQHFPFLQVKWSFFQQPRPGVSISQRFFNRPRRTFIVFALFRTGSRQQRSGRSGCWKTQEERCTDSRQSHSLRILRCPSYDVALSPVSETDQANGSGRTRPAPLLKWRRATRRSMARHPKAAVGEASWKLQKLRKESWLKKEVLSFFSVVWYRNSLEMSKVFFLSG